MSIAGGDVESVSSSVPSSTAGSAPGTPRNRVKFLCSHGGRILPRPADGHLKYVGGETRVICVSRDITFSELMKKLISMFDGEMILKYQLIPEDLDVLVTVKSNEDVRHMIEECDRHELLGAPRLRAFLFTAYPIILDNHISTTTDHHSLEQRYINSVNGIIIHPSPSSSSSIFNAFRPLPVNTSYTTFTISSACSSPRTPPETTSTATNFTSATTVAINNPEFTTLPNKIGSLPRNRSSPSLCNLGYNSLSNHQILNPIATPTPNLNQTHQHNPLNHHLHLHPQPHQSPKPPIDRQAHKISGPEHVGRSSRTRSPGVSDYYRNQMDHHAAYHNPRTNREGGGGHSYYQRGLPYDDYYGNCRYERTDSPPGSPLARSPNGLSPSPSIRLGRS